MDRIRVSEALDTGSIPVGGAIYYFHKPPKTQYASSYQNLPNRDNFNKTSITYLPLICLSFTVGRQAFFERSIFFSIFIHSALITVVHVSCLILLADTSV